MTDPLLHTWNLNLGYAKRLLADIPDETMALQPAPGMNHAAWVLGHLACTADMLGAMIGLKPVRPGDRPNLMKGVDLATPCIRYADGIAPFFRASRHADRR